MACEVIPVYALTNSTERAVELSVEISHLFGACMFNPEVIVIENAQTDERLAKFLQAVKLRREALDRRGDFILCLTEGLSSAASRETIAERVKQISSLGAGEVIPLDALEGGSLILALPGGTSSLRKPVGDTPSGVYFVSASAGERIFTEEGVVNEIQIGCVLNPPLLMSNATRLARYPSWMWRDSGDSGTLYLVIGLILIFVRIMVLCLAYVDMDSAWLLFVVFLVLLAILLLASLCWD